ncbi:MAG TPA: hydrogenase maturation protease [Anaerolineales bacterium]
MRLLLVGIGQEFRGDDAVGVEIVRRWQVEHPETAAQSSVQVELSGLPGLNLLTSFEDVDNAILVDAVISGGKPGSLYELAIADLANFGPGEASAHGWGVAETLALAEALGDGRMPKEVHILAMEVEDISPGSQLSPVVEAAIPAAIQRLETMVRTQLSVRATGKPSSKIGVAN